MAESHCRELLKAFVRLPKTSNLVYAYGHKSIGDLSVLRISNDL